MVFKPFNKSGGREGRGEPKNEDGKEEKKFHGMGEETKVQEV